MNMTDSQALLLAKALVLMGQGIGAGLALIAGIGPGTVSYTHLTLPTIA